MTDNFDYVMANNSCVCFHYPKEIQEKEGVHGFTYSRKELFLLIAESKEKRNAKDAAFFRKVANYYPDCDRDGDSVQRDKDKNILVDFDDWDELSNEQRLVRGNRNSAIAVLDRLRFHLEMMEDEPENNEEVDDIRRGLNEITESISMW